MENTTKPPFFPETEEEEFDFKRYFFVILRQWQWLLACVVVGFTIAYIYTLSKNTKFSTDTKIVVPEANQELSLTAFFDSNLPGSNGQTSVNNEIEILKSYTLTHRAAKNLNWRTFWYVRNRLRWQGLYMSEPFSVIETKGGKNLENIPIYIEPLDDKSYQISVSGTYKEDEVEKDVSVSAICHYNQPFENEYFHVALQKANFTPECIGKTYKFIFKSVDMITKSMLPGLAVEQTDRKSEVIQLSIEGEEKLRNIHFLNELIDVYIDLKLEHQTETQKRSLEFITQQISGISDSLHEAGSNFTRFRANNQIIDLSAQGQIVMTQMGEIENQISQQNMQLDYFRNLLSYLNDNQKLDEVVSPSVVGIQDPTLNALLVKLGELYSRQEVLEFSAHTNNPTLKLLKNEIQQTQNMLQENLSNLIHNAEVTIKTLNNRLNNINRQLNNLPEKEQQLINIQREYELTNTIYTFLLQRRAEIEIALAGAVVDVRIIDPARLERIVPVGFSKMTLVSLGGFTGLALPILFILLFDMLNKRIYLKEDVEKLTSIPVVGSILHSLEAKDLVVNENPSSPIAESFRSVRTNLRYVLKSSGEKVLGLHSVVPGEGKTFNAVNLACILAMNDKNTLLMGADLRRPRLHRIFDVSNKKGLSSYLIGKDNLKEIIHPTQVKSLWVLPGGPVPPNPAELLDRDVFTKLMDTVKANFDFIVIDNSPISMVTDSQITARHSDVNLFVLRVGVSQKDELKFINEAKDQGKVTNPGIIINDIKREHLRYSYSYNYKYSYHKYYY
jgi:tyrosine-protein kinase Etk/Wzc